jgi:hypothetical protein
LIGNDKELLSDKLQSAGYAIDTLVIRTADPHAVQPGLSAGSGASQEQYAGHTNGGPTAYDRSSMRDDNSHSHPALEDDAKDTTVVQPTASIIYDVETPARAVQANIREREMSLAAKRYDVPLAVLYAVGLTDTGRRIAPALCP